MPATDKPLLDSKGELGDLSQATIQESPPPEVTGEAAIPDGYVVCTVTKAGAGRVSKGSIDLNQAAIDPTNPMAPLKPFPYHDKGDTVALPKKVAEGLEDRGLVTT